MLLPLFAAAVIGQAAPTITLTHDNTSITESCTIVIPPGTIIADADGNGVLHVDADDVTITFAAGSVLRGADAGEGPRQTPWDRLAGVGVRISGRSNVRLVNAAVEGFKVGIHATNAPGLAIDRANIRDIFRQRLRSTPMAEDGADWLWPHDNDNRQWMTNYGAAIVVERSDRVTLSNITVRRSQNGLILDRVNHSSIFDNDCSFLSGWGLAMWRSSDNTISRNAFDFCVRGHSEGVYNRGQDSAGILGFEQCSRNLFAENSATHGGDGFFGFAGKEALGETPPPPGFDYANAGCNDNEFRGNDFSFAPAHGLELTFSKRNIVRANTFIENAICGLWGGYSNAFVILDNHFEGNGGMAYGLENGAINIEHGSDTLIAANHFINNRTAIHFWWDHDAALLQRPGVKASYKGVTGNTITGNTIDLSPNHPFASRIGQPPRLTVLRLRDTPDAQGPHVRGTYYGGNTVTLTAPNAVEIDATPGAEPITTFDRSREEFDLPPLTRQPLGERTPVGARKHLAGRRHIIMGEWGPWDHAEPMVRLASSDARTRTYELFGGAGPWFADDLREGGTATWAVPPSAVAPLKLVVTAQRDVHPYAWKLRTEGFERVVRGTIVSATWNARFFTWTDQADPRTNLAAWRALADAPDALHVPALAGLDIPYAHGGPKDQPFARDARGTAPGADRFGMIATASLRLPAGAWAFSTLSDDGVRVLVNGAPVIENWTWHPPSRDTGRFVQPAEGEITITVEHFEIDGYAVLDLAIDAVD